jgi:hypothetical protein
MGAWGWSTPQFSDGILVMDELSLSVGGPKHVKHTARARREGERERS